MDLGSMKASVLICDGQVHHQCSTLPQGILQEANVLSTADVINITWDK